MTTVRKPAKAKTFACVAVLTTFVGIALALPSCAAVSNETAIQCTSEADCVGLGPSFADTTCDKVTKTCQKVVSAAECTLNADCASRGANTICRKSDGKCVNLLSNECTRVMGKPEQVLDDNAIIIGALTPVGPTELGDAIERGIDLAQQDFFPSSTGTGIPTQAGTTRPVVVVSCREFNSDGYVGLIRAANHLVKDIQVPIVIGPVDPTNAQIAATNVLLPNKVLTVLPGAITSNLATLPNPIAPTPLIWRMNYSDTEAVHVVQSFIDQQLVPRMKTEGSLGAAEELRIAIVAEGDYKGLEVQRVFQENLRWNKKADGSAADCADNLMHTPPGCIPTDFGSLNDTLGNPSPEGKISAALGQIFTNKGTGATPHIIIHSYATLGIQRILFPVEASWDAGPASGKPRPYHIGLYPPWNEFTPMFPFMDGQAKAPHKPGYIPISHRNFGLYAHTNVDPQLISNFVLRFSTAFTEFGNDGTAGDVLVRLAYDSFYMSTYAIAGLNGKPITGPNLAAVLPRLTLGEKVQVGPEDIQKAYANLSVADKGINVEGLSGNLDLNAVTAAPKYSMEISCPGVNATTGGTANFVASGFYYDETAQASFGSLPGNCPTLK